MKVIVTGGAGFIGSELIRQIIQETDWQVFNIDKLTYAGNLNSLKIIANNPRYYFQQIDISDTESLKEILQNFQPNAIFHLAAETHVDRSITDPDHFITTNVNGTYNLLKETRKYWSNLNADQRKKFRFHHISTDEVYGSLDDSGYFYENTPYAPNSPYSASKASSDHLVRAWHHTYELPTIITNCSNNYGPYQFPEKLIPLIISNALKKQPLPIYGNGKNIRDWLFVADHARALRLIIQQGKIGETYNIGGNSEKTNLEVVKTICLILDELKPLKNSSYSQLINFVDDRPGHDYRYAINCDKIKTELGWIPTENFNSGIKKTIEWYLNQFLTSTKS